MKIFKNFYVVENKKDWDENYNKRYFLFDGCTISGIKEDEVENQSFPAVYARTGFFDPHCCDDVYLIPWEKAKPKLINIIQNKIAEKEEEITAMEDFLKQLR